MYVRLSRWKRGLPTAERRGPTEAEEEEEVGRVREIYERAVAQVHQEERNGIGGDTSSCG